jgi:hypothetical protein
LTDARDHSQPDPRNLDYRVSWVEAQFDDVNHADRTKVSMRKWAHEGWELVSANAVVYDHPPFVRHTMFWRRQIQ